MQLFINLFGKNKTYNLDKDITIFQLKEIINDIEFIPENIMFLTSNSRLLTNGTLTDNNLTELSCINVNLRIKGGTRYKKSSSQMRWKWKKKELKDYNVDADVCEIELNN